MCMLPQCCGLTCDSWDFLLGQMTSYILSKCGSSLPCGLACAFSDDQLDQMTCSIGHNWELFLCCGLPYDSSNFLLGEMTSHIKNKHESCVNCHRANALPFWFDFLRMISRNIQHLGIWWTERSETFPGKGTYTFKTLIRFKDYCHFYFYFLKILLRMTLSCTHNILCVRAAMFCY